MSKSYCYRLQKLKKEKKKAYKSNPTLQLSLVHKHIQKRPNLTHHTEKFKMGMQKGNKLNTSSITETRLQLTYLESIETQTHLFLNIQKKITNLAAYEAELQRDRIESNSQHEQLNKLTFKKTQSFIACT